MDARRLAGFARTLAIVITSVCGAAGMARAQCPEDFKLTASSPAASDEFGAAVTVYGDWAAIGATGRDGPGGSDSGAVYVFRRNSTTKQWEQKQMLVGSDSAADDNFGWSVSLNGDWLAV